MIVVERARRSEEGPMASSGDTHASVARCSSAVRREKPQGTCVGGGGGTGGGGATGGGGGGAAARSVELWGVLWAVGAPAEHAAGQRAHGHVPARDCGKRLGLRERGGAGRGERDGDLGVLRGAGRRRAYLRRGGVGDGGESNEAGGVARQRALDEMERRRCRHARAGGRRVLGGARRGVSPVRRAVQSRRRQASGESGRRHLGAPRFSAGARENVGSVRRREGPLLETRHRQDDAVDCGVEGVAGLRPEFVGGASRQGQLLDRPLVLRRRPVRLARRRAGRVLFAGRRRLLFVGFVSCGSAVRKAL
mmetsp:Transcript_5954/g.18727  ORF Transcript_5954/g.18727 Transcript_5954/m.18727 type:complete len:307 (-) Transcript_5954:769-1689(-)